MSKCQKLKISYITIQENLNLLRSALKKKEIGLAKKIRGKINENLAEINECAIPIIAVRNAKNPLAEVHALRLNQIPVPEKEDVVWNLVDQLESNIEAYAKLQLVDWVENLEKAKEALMNLSAEKKAFIKKELQDGAIPIFMPSIKKIVTAPEDIDKFSALFPALMRSVVFDTIWQIPTGFQHNTSQAVFQSLRVEASNLSENPYLLLVKPTQNPDAEALKIMVEKRSQKLVETNKKRAKEGRAALVAMNPVEYFVMRWFFAEMAFQNDDNVWLKDVLALDTKNNVGTDFPDYSTSISADTAADRFFSIAYVWWEKKFEMRRWANIESGLRYACRIEL